MTDTLNPLRSNDSLAGGVREALESARHELTTLHGLTASDGLGAYSEALREGCDPAGGWKSFTEGTWQIDTSDAVKKIDAALGKAV